MARTEVILYHLTSFFWAVGRECLPGRWLPSAWVLCGRGSGQVLSVVGGVSVWIVRLFLASSAISTVVVAVYCFFSLLLPANCSYLNNGGLNFCASSSPFCSAKGEGKGREWFGEAVGELYHAVSLLNHKASQAKLSKPISICWWLHQVLRLRRE